MTSFVPRKQNTKNSRLDWINTIVMLHNLQCECLKPLKHTIEEIFKQEPTLKTECLGTEEDIIAEDGFGPGDLDALFAADFGDDPPVAATTSTG